MATLTTNVSAASNGGFFSRVLAFLESIAEARSRTAQVEALMDKSDADLAAMGLTRDTIVLHVFRDKLYA